MEQKYAEPLILCPPMQLNIIKMYILLVSWYIFLKTRTVEQSFKKIVSFVTLDLIKERSIIMKGLNVLAAFLGGAAVGAAIGILFAPEKEKTRVKRLQRFFVRKVSG